ncbi:MAG: DNA recombination protein RmuC [Clostridia bacterium]
MQELLNLGMPMLGVLGLSLLSLVLLVVLAVVQARQSAYTRRFFERAQAETDDLRDALLRQSLEQREELLRSLQQLNDSLFQMVSGVTRAQADQVNALLRQTSESAQGFDQRQQGMQRITEESLSRIEARMQSVEALLARQLAQNEVRMEALRKTMSEGMMTLRAENTQKLEEMRQTVDEKLHDTLEKRLNASFTQVSERLEQVYKSLGEMHSLAAGVGDLKRMLGNVKTRGVWGEMQLGALLEQALTSTQYARNVSVVPGSAERVEFAVCLPGRDGDAPVYLPIDSKFPQEDYTRLAEASQNGDHDAVEGAQRALLTAVRVEAKRIGKYIAPPHTTDFAVMFLPLEGLYAEVMRHAEVVQQLQREQRVLISGPSTLLALLNSLQMGFRTLAIEQRSAEVWKLLGAVKTDFGGFAQVLQKTQEKLQQATDSIDTAFVRTRRIEKKLRKVEALDRGEASQLLDNDDGEEEDK